MAVTITCIIPTIGRDTLAAALESCKEADEVIVVVDDAKAAGWQPEAPAANVKLLHVESCDRGGHSSRNHAMPHATSSHLCFLDDDDIYLPGAIETMRAHACDRPVIFKMDHPQHGILWRDRQVTFGNVSTQMFLVPNDPARLGVWKHHAPELPQPGGDYTFITGCVEKMGEPVWRDEVIAKYDAAMPTFAIVTPWLDHLELVDGYFAAVACASHRDCVHIVDNGSEPALPLEQWYNERLRPRNIGFSGERFTNNGGFVGGCNAGLAAAETDAVLFLNNDVCATSGDWLDQIRAALEPGVLVGANIRNDRHGWVDDRPFPYLDGWCLAGMRDDLDELSGFDEDYAEPAYYSDNDLCLRARAAGMTLRAVRVGLTHLENVTAGRGPGVREVSAANYERFAARARDLIGAAA